MCFNTLIQAWYSAFNLVQTLYFTFMCFNTLIQAWYSAFNLVVQTLYFTFYVFQYFNPSLIFGLQSCTNIVFYFLCVSILESKLIFGLQSCTNIVIYFLCVSILESKLDIRPSILLYKHCILLFMCFNTLIQAWYSASNLVQTLYFTFHVFQYFNPSLIFGLQSCTNIVFYFLCVSILESKLDIRPSILLYKHCILLFMCFNTLIQAWYSAFNLVQTLYFTFHVFQYFNPSLIFGLQSCTNIVFYFLCVSIL